MSVPLQLGRYPVRRRLGSGAFATVWLAYDEHLDSPVAIKVLADNWTEDHHVRRRFIEEGRFLRKVESPYVVTVYDAGELDDSRPFLVMSYADQGTLADRLKHESLTASQAVHVIEQVGTGLHALHQRGVLHRDVKPANVLFRSVELNGERRVSAMLGDLGLGKAMDVSSRLTMIGGTPSFVAPEQAQGESLDARADQYSLAALTYLLLAGRAPYDHASLRAAADPGPPPPLGRDLPAEAEQVLGKALSKERSERYADVPAYLDALRAALRDHANESPTWVPVDAVMSQPVGRPTAVRAPARSKRLLAAFGAAALVVGLLSGFAAHRLAVTTRTISTGSITVTVPASWTHVDKERWTPPGDGTDQPSVAAGDSADWNENVADPGEGVFVGVLPAESLPTTVPHHPECTTAEPPVDDLKDGDAYITVEFTGCAGGSITIERVVQVTSNRLLWVQVRAADRTVAYEVLDNIETPGM